MVVPNVATPTTSNIALTSLFTLNSPQTVTTNIFDQFGNAVISKQSIVLRVTGQGQDIYQTFTSITNSQYQATYSITSGNATTSNCGYFTLNSYLLTQGGLIGSYFPNRWFAGSPYSVKVDPAVNFNWVTGMIIPEVASNYVSVMWQGFIVVPSTDNYVFQAQANDGIKVTLNSQVIIDNSTIAADELSGNRVTTAPISLFTNTFYPIKVEYF